MYVYLVQSLIIFKWIYKQIIGIYPIIAMFCRFSFVVLVHIFDGIIMDHQRNPSHLNTVRRGTYEGFLEVRFSRFDLLLKFRVHV